MSKTQRRRHQRTKKDAILEMQQKNGLRALLFNKITEGPPLGFEKKILSKEHEDKEVITNYFEFCFEYYLEAICGVISILPIEYIEDYQNRHIFRDCEGRLFQLPFFKSKGNLGHSSFLLYSSS